MTPTEWWTAHLPVIDRFIQLASMGGSEVEKLPMLQEAMAALVLAYHAAPDVDPVSDTEPPPRDGTAIYALVAKRFPELGVYHDVEPLPPDVLKNPEIGIADAIDDIADIVSDLQEARWLGENASPEEGVWSFWYGYQSHWGKHLFRLSQHLHWVLYD